MIEQGGEPLSASARALLDAARPGLAPDAAAIGRIKAKVAASTGAGAGIAIAIKLGLLSIVAALAIGAAVHVSRSRDSDTPAVALPTAGSESPPPAIGPSTASDPAPPAAAAPVAAAPRAEGATLAREVELIDAAMAALKRNDASAALASIRVHARETRGAGQLAEDAAAIEIEALCRLHDDSIAAKLDAFDARFPSSAQRSRLTTVCR